MRNKKRKVEREDFSPHQIKEELARIISSSEFTSSDMLARFLEFVVEETLAGRSDQIKEYTIGVKALGRSDDFNPQVDAIVRIHAGRLRRALLYYYDGPGAQDPIRIHISKGAYVPTFEKLESARGDQAERPLVSEDADNRTIDRPSREMLTIAVLPFQNLGNDRSQDFFVGGLGEQLGTGLARFQYLSVMACYSTRRFVEEAMDVRQMGSHLGARYILTGGVRRDERHLRINVQLILTETGVQIWSRTFDRDLSAGNLFEIEDEIVQSVASAVGGYYGVIIRDVARASRGKRVEDLDVYDAVIWYYYFQTEFTEDIFQKARAALERAVQTDPEYALAWAILGAMYVNGYALGYKNVEKPVERALKCARKSIKHDPQCQHGYQTLALAYLFLHDREACLQAMEQCIALNPHAALPLGAMAFVMACVGEYDRALKLYEASIKLNPYYPWSFNVGLFLCYYHQREYEKALQWAQKMDMPHIFWDPLLRAAALGQLKRPEARQALDEMLGADPQFAKHAQDSIGMFILPEDLIVHLLEGLRKAGMKRA